MTHAQIAFVPGPDHCVRRLAAQARKSEAALARLRAAFDFCDKNSDGHLTRAEIIISLRKSEEVGAC